MRTTATKRLVGRVFGDVLAEEELQSVIAWGRTVLDDRRSEPMAKGDTGEREHILQTVEEALLSSWWEPLESRLPARASDDSYALPRKDHPLVKVFADAVRALASKRITAAWVD